jgi:hypothetical protein
MADRWNWPWYHILGLYLSGLVLGFDLGMLLLRLRQADSIFLPILLALVMLLVTGYQLWAAWRGQEPEYPPIREEL